jgi:hypothetical protein
VPPRSAIRMRQPPHLVAQDDPAYRHVVSC